MGMAPINRAGAVGNDTDVGATRMRSEWICSTDQTTQLTRLQVNCILKELPNTSCGLTDISCMCEQTALWKNSTACVIQTCTVKEALSKAPHPPFCQRSKLRQPKEQSCAALRINGCSFDSGREIPAGSLRIASIPIRHRLTISMH